MRTNSPLTGLGSKQNDKASERPYLLARQSPVASDKRGSSLALRGARLRNRLQLRTNLCFIDFANDTTSLSRPSRWQERQTYRDHTSIDCRLEIESICHRYNLLIVRSSTTRHGAVHRVAAPGSSSGNNADNNNNNNNSRVGKPADSLEWRRPLYRRQASTTRHKPTDCSTD